MSKTEVDLSSLVDRKIGKLKVESSDELSPYMNILLYGDPGVGKTVLAASASEVPEMSPVAFVDFEGGTMSIRGFHNVDILRVSSVAELEDLYTELKRGSYGYRTVVIDSLTELQNFSMADIMRQVVKADTSRDPDVPSMREWGKNGTQVARAVRAYRDLPMNVIFTALAKSDKDSRPINKPALQGQLADRLPGFVDIVAYMYKEVKRDTNKRMLLTEGTATTVAKDRSRKLPQVVENPTMADLYAYIFRTSNQTKEN